MVGGGFVRRDILRGLAVLIGYGLAMGAMAALLVPARDALRTRVVNGGVPARSGSSPRSQLG